MPPFDSEQLMDSHSKPGPTKPRWRFVRFSLRGLLILITVLAVWLGWCVNRASKQRDAVRRIKENGGGINYGFDMMRGNPPHYYPYPPFPKWFVKMLGVDFLCTVKTAFHHHDCPFESFDVYAAFPEVELLDIRDLKASDLTPLTSLSKLVFLNVQGSPIKDLTSISRMTQLRTLGLENTEIDDISPLINLQNLKVLILCQTRVRDIKCLSQLTKLERVVLDGTDVSDISPILNLPNLRDLWIRQTDISETDYQRLQAALPNCKILWSHR